MTNIDQRHVCVQVWEKGSKIALRAYANGDEPVVTASKLWINHFLLKFKDPDMVYANCKSSGQAAQMRIPTIGFADCNGIGAFYLLWPK